MALNSANSGILVKVRTNNREGRGLLPLETKRLLVPPFFLESLHYIVITRMQSKKLPGLYRFDTIADVLVVDAMVV